MSLKDNYGELEVTHWRRKAGHIIPYNRKVPSSHGLSPLSFQFDTQKIEQRGRFFQTDPLGGGGFLFPRVQDLEPDVAGGCSASGKDSCISLVQLSKY